MRLSVIPHHRVDKQRIVSNVGGYFGTGVRRRAIRMEMNDLDVRELFVAGDEGIDEQLGHCTAALQGDSVVRFDQGRCPVRVDHLFLRITGQEPTFIVG